MKKEILSSDQIKILQVISSEEFLSKNFYLTGGTALAGFYLHHRLSEDLDFFSEQEFDITTVTIFFEKNKAKLGIHKIDFQQSYNRNLFFLHLKNEVIKTEFTYFPFPRINKAFKKDSIAIDSPLDIAVNKLFTIYQQTRARDYIDLYCLIKKYKWSIDELVKKARIKFDWHIDYLQLGTQFIKSKNAIDFPRMIVKIPSKDWISFFDVEARKLKNKIVE